MKFNLAKCVWGADYVRTMLTLNIPSLLSDGNIDSVRRHRTLEHVIYTTPADRETILEHEAYRRLAATVPCRLETLPEYELSGGYLDNIARMNLAHNLILADCERNRSVWLFDQPDHVWSDGSLAYLTERAVAGARCVMFAGIRTILEEMAPALAAFRQADGALTVSSRSLLKLAVEHMHLHDRVRFWGPETATVWPHHLSWRVGPRAFVRRAFYAQPFLIVPPPGGVRAERSVDMHYVDQAFPDVGKLVFADDTDHFLVVEVSPRIHVQDNNAHPVTVPLVAAWAAEHAGDHQIGCFNRPMRFHVGEVPEHRWRHIERFSADVASAVAMGRRFHALHRAAADRPSLATVLGRLLRNPAAMRRLRPVEPFTLLLPDETALEQVLPLDDGALAAAAAACILPGDRPLAGLLPVLKKAGVGVGRGDLFLAGIRCHEIRTASVPSGLCG